MRTNTRRALLSSCALGLALCSVVMLSGPPATAQPLTHARSTRLARALAMSTVTIETDGRRGSGFVVGSERWVLTTFHLVDESARGSRAIDVRLGSGTSRRAQVFEADPDHDLALLTLAGGRVPAPPLELGDSDAIAVGQRVISLGAFVAGAPTLAESLVTARPDLQLTLAPLVERVIRTDATMTEDLTGGPLVDRAGHVIGVRWAGIRGSETLDFAIPSSYVSAFLARVRAAHAHDEPRVGSPSAPAQ